MNILMMTNTFTPHIGGVARSVEAFAANYRKHGHRVLTVAPQFENVAADESGVVRVPAIQNFNGSDFSVRLPIPGFLSAVLDEFNADVVHSHHPFLLGDTALRAAARRNQPLVFTHHTMYEQYTHYVPANSEALQRFVIQLSVGYANLCDQVIAPSESVESVLRDRGVTAPIAVIPTGVEVDRFVAGDGASFRRRHRIPARSFVVGHVGRLAPEKNLQFLTEAVCQFLRTEKRAHFVVVGSGPFDQQIKAICKSQGTSRRLHLAGPLAGQDLIDAYHSMDAFAFASCSETQGMVLTEAMAAGVPVVALDAPGAREVVRDEQNGRLLQDANTADFASALGWITDLRNKGRRALVKTARDTAGSFSMHQCAEKAIGLYESVLSRERVTKPENDSAWSTTLRVIETEWQLWVNVARAATAAVKAAPAKDEAAA
jgi:glycosyltransferase involved in cell wall biosynthesis